MVAGEPGSLGNTFVRVNHPVDDREAARQWQEDKTQPQPHHLSKASLPISFAYFDRCPLLGQLSKHIPKGSRHQDPRARVAFLPTAN